MKIDTTKSQVVFTVKKLGFLTVKGIFETINGEINLDPNNLVNSSIDIAISIEGVSTNNKKRDEHLLQKDFFNIEEFPEMTFKSTSISNVGKTFTAKGELCIAGIKNEVEIPFNFDNNVALGNFNIKRKDYNFGKLPTFVASNNVDITFSCTVN